MAMSELTRRECMAGAAALAAARWEEVEYDIEEAEEWEPMDGGCFPVGELSVGKLTAFTRCAYSAIEFEHGDLTDRQVTVHYWEDGVSLITDAEGGDHLAAGQLVMFTPDEARELAGMLYQGAEELDRRTVGDASEGVDGDD